MYQTKLSSKSNSAELQKDPFKQDEDDLRILMIRMEKDLWKSVVDWWDWKDKIYDWSKKNN